MPKLETVRFVAEAIILQKKDGRECPCHLLIIYTSYLYIPAIAHA